MYGLTWVLALVSEALCKLLSPAKHVCIDQHPWTNMGGCPGERVPLEINITHEAMYGWTNMHGLTNMRPMLVERYKGFFNLLRQTAAFKLDSLSLSPGSKLA